MTGNVLLWAGQVVLAVVFLCAGGFKLFAGPEMLTTPMPLPTWFLRLVGAAEIAGSVGLVLPWMLRVVPGLTIVAAVGLSLITTSAAVITFVGGDARSAWFPFVVALGCASIAYGRGKQGAAFKTAALRGRLGTR